MRPLIVFSVISVLLLTFYIREGEAGRFMPCVRA